MDSLNPRARTELKDCQKSCKGLMLYFSQTAAPHEGSDICLGVSSSLPTPQLDLHKVHEARQVPNGQHVDFAVILGHSITSAASLSSPEQALPPACMRGIEFLRFARLPEAAGSETMSPSSASAGPKPTGASRSTAPSILGLSMETFRVLTSGNDMNARFSKAWESVTSFDATKYAEKFSKAAVQNVHAMSKWLRDLGNAISGPKA